MKGVARLSATITARKPSAIRSPSGQRRSSSRNWRENWCIAACEAHMLSGTITLASLGDCGHRYSKARPLTQNITSPNAATWPMYQK